MAITYEELSKECEFWRNQYLSDNDQTLYLTREQIRLVYLALVAAKAARVSEKKKE